MAIAYHTDARACAQETGIDHTDLVRRYCPGLEGHSPEQVARHIPNDPTTCWPWDGWINKEGYGEVWLEATPYGYTGTVQVHRYMYTTLVGEIPETIHIHHRCRYKACWNPLHLEALTPKEHRERHRTSHEKGPRGRATQARDMGRQYEALYCRVTAHLRSAQDHPERLGNAIYSEFYEVMQDLRSALDEMADIKARLDELEVVDEVERRKGIFAYE